MYSCVFLSAVGSRLLGYLFVHVPAWRWSDAQTHRSIKLTIPVLGLPFLSICLSVCAEGVGEVSSFSYKVGRYSERMGQSDRREWSTDRWTEQEGGGQGVAAEAWQLPQQGARRTALACPRIPERSVRGYQHVGGWSLFLCVGVCTDQRSKLYSSAMITLIIMWCLFFFFFNCRNMFCSFIARKYIS